MGLFSFKNIEKKVDGLFPQKMDFSSFNYLIQDKKFNYYFDDQVLGCALVSNTLIQDKGCDFELVAYTENEPTSISEEVESINFLKFQEEIVAAINQMSSYRSLQAIKPFQTLSADSYDGTGLNYFIVLPNPYKPSFEDNGKSYKLLTLMLIHQSEFNTIKKNNDLLDLIDLLQNKGYEPFSNPDRPSVI